MTRIVMCVLVGEFRIETVGNGVVSLENCRGRVGVTGAKGVSVFASFELSATC